MYASLRVDEPFPCEDDLWAASVGFLDMRMRRILKLVVHQLDFTVPLVLYG
jgi:hypothetical protein